MWKATMWQKLNGESLPRYCQKGEIKPGLKEASYCEEKAMFRTKVNDEGEHGTKDLTEYKHYCAKHTYL